jgi:hypothetical protein
MIGPSRWWGLFLCNFKKLCEDCLKNMTLLPNKTHKNNVGIEIVY